MDSSHAHDMDVTSISIECSGALNLIQTEQWLGGLPDARGEDIMRMKGLLCCQTTTVTTSPIQSVANDGNNGIYTVFIAEWTTLETTLEIDRGSPSFTPSIVMTMDVVGFRVFTCATKGA